MSDAVSREEELRAMLALDAVSALGDDERSELARALRDRPDLQAELEELRAAAALLGDAASEPPPPSLRASVLDAVAATPQDPSVAPVVPLARRRRVSRWVAAGAVAAAAIGGVAAGLIMTRDGDGEGDQVATVLDDPGAVTIDMPATPDGELIGTISIVYSPDESAAVLRGDGLDAPAGDSVYQLWAIRDGNPEPDVTFRPEDGDVELYLPDLDPTSAEAWAVTREPRGGSRTPTPPILAITG
jgi:anti-sigma-K factor RskA